MEYVPNEKLYEKIREICMERFSDPRAPRPVELMEEIWKRTDFPMHCPEHHYLMAAVLLCVYRRLKQEDETQLSDDLDRALERGRKVPAGSCGQWGTCGAAVGCGIFLSVFTDATPYSTDAWGLANRLTAESLSAIAALGGPRCCKRVCFTAVGVAVRFMREAMGLVIEEEPPIVCGFYSNNAECKKTLCPYYDIKAGDTA